MTSFLEKSFANPSSGHSLGLEARRALEYARAKLASLLNAAPEQIIFTSGGTEANNMAIHSALYQSGSNGRNLITTNVEHSSVRHVMQNLEKNGMHVIWLSVNQEGALDLNQLRESITPETALVSIMWANNETGVLFPIEEIAEICRKKSVLFHTDAVQICGKLPIDLKRTQVDFLSLSAHKFHGPKGIGALFARHPEQLHPLISGGHQEHSKRGGTENISGIIGMAAATELARNKMQRDALYTQSLRDFFEAEVLRLVPNVKVNGSRTQRLGHVTNFSFEGIDSETLLYALNERGVYASSASACTTGSLTPSYVLRAMGLPLDRTLSSIRFSFSRYNSRIEIENVMEWLPKLVAELRSKSPL